MSTPATVVRGTNKKPVSSSALADYFLGDVSLDGQLYIGYPVISTPDGRFPLDAVYVSPTKGIVVFDLWDGIELGDYRARQDDGATKLQSRLLTYRDLVRKRVLGIPVTTITYAPALATRNTDPVNIDYPLSNAETIGDSLGNIFWDDANEELYNRAISAIQSISTIRRSRTAREITKADSRGAVLQTLENSIATLDTLQGKAVIETVDGVQRIRGLAGSGKTIVLALKAAYLHAQHPEWRIAVTFNTRSLKGQFNRLINGFVIEQTGEEPDWKNLRVLNAWGAPGGGPREGIYHEFCAENGVEYMDFNAARSAYGREGAFEGAISDALSTTPMAIETYDAMLVDEAQDFPPNFLRLCYAMLRDKKRLVYAYDELQTLSGSGVPSATDLFGTDEHGEPIVSLSPQGGDQEQRRDIILEKCYRNSRPMLVTAHGLGFGIYRKPPAEGRTGLVQMFDQPQLWAEIGYKVATGELRPGHQVTLERTPDTSPLFLEKHSPVSDLIEFRVFETTQEHDNWIAEQIEINLSQDEMRPDDIVVINTNPISTRNNLGPIRRRLLERNIANHLAGVDTGADVFFAPEQDSITFTGVYRAKGNEAGMVYVVHAEECNSSTANLARVRNRLFTAITRSKAWVRVTGVGSEMQALKDEFDAVKAQNFRLQFQYPTDAERAQLQIVHRDMNAAQMQDVRRSREFLGGVLSDLEAKRLFIEDLDPEVMDRLKQLLSEQND